MPGKVLCWKLYFSVVQISKEWLSKSWHIKTMKYKLKIFKDNLLRTNVGFFLLLQLLIFFYWEMSSVYKGVCKHIKWKFYTIYRCFSWRKEVSQKLRKLNKMLKMKKENLWKLIVNKILVTDCEKNGVIFFCKNKKKKKAR